MIDIDFIDTKKVIKYLLTVTLLIIGGVIVKDISALLIVLTIFFFILSRRIYHAIELCFIWFFIYSFFVGQGYLTNAYLIKYLAKPSFLFFLIFILFLDRLPVNLFKAPFFLLWLLFVFFAVLGTMIQGQSPLIVITWSGFLIVYLILQAKGISIRQSTNLLNLFIAIAILQTIISFLQLSQIIPPPTKIMDDGSGGNFKWVAGLDDVASGTFGPGAGHLTSWYAALTALIMLLVWSLTKKRIYIVLGGFIFLQFATIDSKTILGVAILMIAYTLYYIARKREMFNIKIGRYIYILIFLAIGGYGFYSAWDSYYQYYSEETKTQQRTGVNAVMDNMVKETNSTILDNIGDWGKVKGFQYIFNDFHRNDISQILWGYGLNGYTYNGKMSYIESLDAPAMKLNNFTKSRSGLISIFAQTGVVGSFLYCLSFLYWKSFNNCKITERVELLSVSLLKIFFTFSILAAFLYSISTNSIPIITFVAFISILTSMSRARLLQVKNSAIHEAKTLNPIGI